MYSYRSFTFSKIIQVICLTIMLQVKLLFIPPPPPIYFFQSMRKTLFLLNEVTTNIANDPGLFFSHYALIF